MNKIQLLQKTQSECIPKLSEAVERIRRVFPKFEIKPSSLERTPSADTFVTAKLEQEGADGCNMVNDYINTTTQRVRSRITTEAYVSEPANISSSSCKLEELNADGKPTVEVFSDSHGFTVGREHSYNSRGKKVETREILPTSENRGTERVTKFDENGNPICIEEIPHNLQMARTKEVINPDGSKTRTIYQTKLDSSNKPIGDIEIVEEITNKNKTSRVTKTINGKTDSFVEYDPETGHIRKLNIGDYEQKDLRLIAEYDPKYKMCTSVEVKNVSDGITRYKATYKDYVPVEVEGTLVDKLSKEGKSTEDIARLIGTPHIMDDKSIKWSNFDDYNKHIIWDRSILYHPDNIRII